jgi:murein L,D-transpeptidase YafK
MPCLRRFLAAALLVAATLAEPAHAEGLSRSDLSAQEALLTRSLHAIRAGKLDTALREIDRLIALQPDFKLAHLIRGDLLLAKAGPLPGMGGRSLSHDAGLQDLREEARLRLLSQIEEPAPDKLPKQILQLAPSQKFALLADASKARLYVFENHEGHPRLLRHFFMTVGRNGIEKRIEGDKRTPVGVYTITDQIPRARLTDFYGAGAFPLNYPNEWDQTLGRTGHGIWLHGVPSDTYNRAPRASDGCVVVANADFNDISQYVQVGVTPVLISERIEWLEPEAWQSLRQDLLAKLDTWKGDWERQDSADFLAHYSSRFLFNEGKGWVESKRRNIANKDWIKLELTDLSLFLDLSQNMAVATFTQAYGSNVFHSTTRKRMYLSQENGKWHIALEKSLLPDTIVAGREPPGSAGLTLR